MFSAKLMKQASWELVGKQRALLSHALRRRSHGGALAIMLMALCWSRCDILVSFLAVAGMPCRAKARLLFEKILRLDRDNFTLPYRTLVNSAK